MIQTRVIDPALPMRCHGNPSTRASSWTLSSGQLLLPWAAQMNLPWCRSARGQPDAQPIVHQEFEAVAAPVGKQVGGVRMGGAKDGNDSRQRAVGAATHVHGGGGQPHRIDADHWRTALVQLANSAAALPAWTGQVTTIVSAPLRSSILIS